MATTSPRYALQYRPPSFCTLPSGLRWYLVERPAIGFEKRTDLPVSRHPFGVFTAERALTPEELTAYEIEVV